MHILFPQHELQASRGESSRLLAKLNKFSKAHQVTTSHLFSTESMSLIPCTLFQCDCSTLQHFIVHTILYME